MRTLVIVGLCLSMSGCLAYSRWQETSANADRLSEHAAILKLYRLCLEKYQDDPAKAKVNCEHYTQSLQSIDVRGLK